MNPIYAGKALKDIAGNNFHVVRKDVLYRCAQPTKKHLKKYIEKYGIKTVINLRGAHPEKSWWVNEQEVTTAYNVQLINIAMSADELPSKENLKTLLDTYANAEYPMLIHCRAGVDRTGEAAAIWLMDQRNFPKDQALEQLTLKYRHVSSLHPAKRFFVNAWQGRDWALNQYNPADYPAYAIKKSI